MNLDSVFLENKGSRNTESPSCSFSYSRHISWFEVMELQMHPVTSFLSVPAA